MLESVTLGCAARGCDELLRAPAGTAKAFCIRHRCPVLGCPGRLEPGRPTVPKVLPAGACFRHRCQVEGCDAAVIAKRYCSKHWKRWRRHGDPTVVGKPGRPPAPVRPVWEQAPGWEAMSPRSRARLARAGRTLVRLGGWEQALAAATRPGGTVNVSEVARAAEVEREAARSRREWAQRAARAEAGARSGATEGDRVTARRRDQGGEPGRDARSQEKCRSRG